MTITNAMSEGAEVIDAGQLVGFEDNIIVAVTLEFGETHSGTCVRNPDRQGGAKARLTAEISRTRNGTLPYGRVSNLRKSLRLSFKRRQQHRDRVDGIPAQRTGIRIVIQHH